MDREIIYAIFAAVVGLSIVGSLMLGPKASSAADEQVHAYAPEDIRYRLQKTEIKKRRKPHAQTSAPETLAPAGSTSSGGGDGDASDESQEEPSLADEPDAEEPPLD
jgi:hypothetical protein